MCLLHCIKTSIAIIVAMTRAVYKYFDAIYCMLIAVLVSQILSCIVDNITVWSWSSHIQTAGQILTCSEMYNIYIIVDKS